MAVVTISRQFGAGARTLGERLCHQFGFHLVDELVIDELARKAKISPDWLNAMEKQVSSWLLSLISSIVSSGLLYRTPASPGEGFERMKYIDYLTQIMTSMANEGGYVIVGRGGQLVLRNHPKALHILLVGEHEDRVKFLVREYDVSRKESERMIKDKGNQRAAVASTIFGADIDDPRLYHMVLNTSRMPFERALDLASDLLTRFMKKIGELPNP